MSIKISGVLPGPTGEPAAHIGIILRATQTSSTVLRTLESHAQTDARGQYALLVEPGRYDVLLWVDGVSAQPVGNIRVYSDSLPGTLNDYLTQLQEGDATPEIIRQLEQLRNEARQSAIEAKQSAAESSRQAAVAIGAANQAAGDTAILLTQAVKEDADRAANEADRATREAGRAITASQSAAEVKNSIDTTARQVTQQHGEAVQAASNAKASETQAANSAGTATAAAGTAVTAKDQAAVSAQSASHSADASQGSSTQAAGSAVAAAGSAVTAKNEADRATVATDGKLDKTGGELSGGLKISGLFAAATPGANGYPTQLALVGSGGISNQSGGNNGVGFHDDGNTYFWNRKGNVTDYNVIMAPTETTFKKPIVGNSSITSGAQIIVAPQTAENYSAIWLRKPGNSDNACQLTYDKGDKFFISTPTSFHRFSTDCIALVDTRTVTGSDGGLIKGSVQVSTSYSTWRERAAGIMIDTPFDNATSVQNVFKVTRWGAEHIAGMQVHASPTTSAITMNFRNNAQHVFAENGSISTTSPTIIGERVLSYNGDIYGTAWRVGGNPGWLTAKLAQTRNTSNTTVDANGFIKAASPVIRLFNNSRFDDVAYYSVPEGFTPAGSGAVNSEAKGVMAERISEGVYQVTGAQGFAIDGWQIELPTDDNRQPLIWAEREVDETGQITIHTYHREHPNSPPFAQNKREGYTNGQPVDIPHGRWVDLRLEMGEAVKPE
ncbi:prophage tail fiber N-terminal domain-containing protein [Yersinia ruckeri]|uniref:phage tail fiber protein n=1 Tax=Yersinia ruckeri TaxID=29486 RepID=UPI001F3242E4|nr:prophage tail fiber N-terminal domain-containing protein [Yersinia ruckeri]MCW6595545.1 prophage tail fiber N-terminal domain-containing protein [Yersinia ruckeri]UIN15397.1 prophage tail fiber N-terminal domain-containing protein [Yersinia ruckeri]UIN18778.1 prophage tail fiber N-terminal domain-containing protein [Yersinia ruckeri]